MGAFGMLREPVNALSHGLGAMLAIIATIYLWTRADSKPGARLACLIYGASLTFCLGTSAVFHSIMVSGPVFDRVLALDQVGIFLLIAGTYTPLAWNVLDGTWRKATLICAWSMAAFGGIMHLVSDHPPIVLSTLLYLVMGWGALICYREVVLRAPRGAHWWLLGGGVLYSVGAIFNVIEWPNPWPTILGFHGIFHLFVLAGAATHFVLIEKTSRPFIPAWKTSIPRPAFFRGANRTSVISSNRRAGRQL